MAERDFDNEDMDVSEGSQSSGSGGRFQGRERGFRRGQKFTRRAKVCPFCQDRSSMIDYKRVDLLQRFLTDRGSIRSRRKIGTCARHQRLVAVAIKQARHLALLPYTAEHIRGA